MPLIATETVSIILFIIIFFEDVKSREVHLWLYISAFAVFSYKFYTAGMPFEFVLVNGVFILSQLVVIVGYSYFKSRNILSIKGVVGLGDILMWGLLILAFSPVNFILFFISSLIISLILHLLFLKQRYSTIPLAGLQALSYIPICALQLLNHNFSSYSDMLWFNIFANAY